MPHDIDQSVIIELGTTFGENPTVRHRAILGISPMVGAMSKRGVTEDLPPLRIGDDVRIGVNAVIYKGTVIGDECLIADGASIREEVVIGDRSSIGRMVVVEPRTRIGSRVRVASGCHLTTDMIIEDDVFLGVGVITANDNTMGRQKSPVYKGAHIKKRARVGSNVTLMPGVVIGEDAVVGAGSNVTRNVADRTVVMGNPASAVVHEVQKLDEIQRMINEGEGFA